MRHLPDISDTTFQIPFADNLDDLLLANNDDFLDGTEDSINTPGAEKIGQDLLTLSQLTPRPKPRTNTVTPGTSVLAIPEPHHPVTNLERDEILHRQTAVAQTRDFKPQASTRTTGKAAPNTTEATDVTALVSKLPTGRAQRHRSVSPQAEHHMAAVKIRRANKKPTVAGGISKTLDKLPKSSLARAMANKPQSRPLLEKIIHEAQLCPDASTVSDDPGPSRAADSAIYSTFHEPVATRFLQHGQILEPSFGLYNSEENFSGDHCQELPIVSHNLGVAKDSSTGVHARSLTLADLSPRRPMNAGLAQDTELLLGPAPPKSPVRVLKKRTRLESPKKPRKKGKMNNTRTHAAVLQPSMRSNVDPIRSGSNLGSSGGDRGKKDVTSRTSRHQAVRAVKGRVREDGSQAGFSISTKSKSGRHPQNNVLHQGDPELLSGQMRCSEGPKTLTHTNPTKWVEFKFRLDARMEARKAEPEAELLTGGNKLHNRHEIPDFKALHAAEEARLARRDKYTPVVPLPLHLSTDDRMRERRKFDEMMKERERENERVTEERRKQREAEEEREIKEIRRRAVPKAHEVPEWYVYAPKRKETGEGGR